MADEVSIQDVETAPVTESVEPIVEPVATEKVDEQGSDTHPLEPGGKRFKEVWARAKRAEDELSKEREAKIALETELRVRKELGEKTQDKDTEKVYTWDELEGLIDSGNLTRAQANDYREKIIRKQIVNDTKQAVAKEQTDLSVLNTVGGEITRYTTAFPLLLDQTSPDYKRVEAEYQWLAQIHGTPKADIDKRKLQLTALRTVYGTADVAEKKASLAQAKFDGRDTDMSTEHATQTAHDKTQDGPPKGLSAAETEHYTKMIKQGRYKDGWKSVHEEIAFYNKVKGIK